jgi:hypothetical protein
MHRIKFMIQFFLKEPLWFRLLLSITFLTSIIFSSSAFSNNAFYEGLAKFAAAIFFSALGMKMRMNRIIAIILFALAAFCIYLSILALY